MRWGTAWPHLERELTGVVRRKQHSRDAEFCKMSTPSARTNRRCALETAFKRRHTACEPSKAMNRVRCGADWDPKQRVVPPSVDGDNAC